VSKHLSPWAFYINPIERLGAEYTAIDGTGIGLSISKRLTELMGGTIGVESKTGHGSTFRIELPTTFTVTKETAASEHISTPAAQECSAFVLYIENTASNIKLVEAIIEKSMPGITLMTAKDGGDGLSKAQQYRPDIIFLDIKLPDMDGCSVLKQLKRNPATLEIPVLALSANAMQYDIERGLAAGFKKYLTKPVQAEALVRAILNHTPSRRDKSA